MIKDAGRGRQFKRAECWGYSRPFEVGLCLEEVEQIGIDLIRMSGAHPMREAGMDLQFGVLHDQASPGLYRWRSVAF
jgi:hypothetical protein